MTTEATWGARRPNLVGSVVSQIVSVDVATGDRVEHTSGPGLKVFPQFLSATEIASHRKGGADEGLYYTSGRPAFKAALRSPAWSPDGKTVIYEKVDFKPRPQNQRLYSWDPEWDYQHTDVFPLLSRDGKLVITEKAQNSSLAIMNPDGSDRKRIFETDSTGLDRTKVARGTGRRLRAELVAGRCNGSRSVSASGSRSVAPARPGSCECAGTARARKPLPTARCIPGFRAIPPTASRSSIASGARTRIRPAHPRP